MGHLVEMFCDVPKEKVKRLFQELGYSGTIDKLTTVAVCVCVPMLLDVNLV